MGPVATRTAVLANGLRLPYAETGDPAGEPVVLVHAYVESWRYFAEVLAHLPQHLHGIAPTQRGHGGAGRPEHGYLPGDFADDLVAFLDALAIDRAVLVGTSSGGLVSQLVASTHPERVSALVLVSSPAHLGDKEAVRAMLADVSTLEDPIDRGFVEEFVRSTSPATVPDELVAAWVDESLQVPARVWRDVLRGLVDTDVRPHLADIAAPTLLVVGDEDPFVRADQRVLLDAIPDARLVVHEGVGHGVHMAQPGGVVTDITDFLAAL
ncbi:alpha/beta fold hydrolase [Nocardioides sediminis]|uniref:alpha/beta fold hydrolase n=1 Tax=Nocardioides sediminis TaxID=433648 RepID=UPI000D31F54B|nr:alpha/beta hydrolase [Nocardioides sediminis]